MDSKPPKQRKERFVRSVAIALALIMVAGAGLGVFSLVKKSPDKEKVTLAVPLFMTHSPILIEGDAALTVANGVNGGDGTAGNPFVIQGWDINASGAASGVGIGVSNITSHLVITNVNIHSVLSTNITGIELWNVTDCTVEHTQTTGVDLGIGAMTCDDLVIQNNTVENSGIWGILVFESNYSLVTHNIAARNTGMGVALANCTGSSVTNNTMSYNGGAGLGLIMCNRTTVSGNIMDNNSVGLGMMVSNWSIVDHNKVVRSSTNGVSMMGCFNNTLFSNMIADTTTDGSMWTGYGAWLLMCANNTFYHNDFLHNQMSPQAYDFPFYGTNYWNLSYPMGGNYWSDYTGSDLNSGSGQNSPGPDGIGDTPYDIGPMPTVNDSYPQMTELTYGNAPTAFFTVTPASVPASNTFTFNASLCWDPDDLTTDLQVRWDFDSDGTWDTGWSTNKIIQHSYGQVGEYNVTMMVKDPAGHSSNATWPVEVDLVAIPEFTTLLVPICSMIAIFLVIALLGKRR